MHEANAYGMLGNLVSAKAEQNIRTDKTVIVYTNMSLEGHKTIWEHSSQHFKYFVEMFSLGALDVKYQLETKELEKYERALKIYNIAEGTRATPLNASSLTVLLAKAS